MKNRLTEPQRISAGIARRYGLPALAGLLYLLIIVNCSHNRPYYRPGEISPADTAIGASSIRQRVLLIGDAGGAEAQEPSLATLQAWAAEMPEKTAVIFLGDNIYPKGLPPENVPQRAEAEQRLLRQLEAVKASGARGIFVPGNHDWAKGAPEGRENLLRQEKLVNDFLPGENNFLPPGGCPGPVEVDLEGVRIIVLDTHWWLHLNQKPSSECPQGTEDAVLEELTSLLNSAGEREVLIAAHHPLVSHGPHGGFFTWKDHLFPLTNLKRWLWIPLPVIGSIYPLFRGQVIKHDQDLAGERYRRMVRRITGASAAERPLVYAAGHEHSLQVLEGEKAASYVLVSGAGTQTKITGVSDGENTLFAHSHTGFMALDFLTEGRVLLRVVEPGRNGVVFRKWLKGEGKGMKDKG